jgi:hypothetical protein
MGRERLNLECKQRRVRVLPVFLQKCCEFGGIHQILLEEVWAFQVAEIFKSLDITLTRDGYPRAKSDGVHGEKNATVFLSVLM